MESDNQRNPISRIRNIDWRRALTALDESPQGTSVCVGVLDQSVRTHINKGRYDYIDPAIYGAYSKAVPGSRTRAHIYLYRRADEGTAGSGLGENSQ